MGEPDEIEWYIQRNGREHGPLTLRELKIFLYAGHSRDDDVFRYRYRASPNRNAYLAASEIDEFLKKLVASPQPSENMSNLHNAHSKPSRIESTIAILHALFDQISSTFSKTWFLVSSPEKFGRCWIVKSDSSSIRGALSFFTTCFSISFLILAFTSKFSYYSGNSEIRILIKISLQLLFGIGFLYALIRLFRSNIEFSSMTKLILYFDGIYLILSSTIYACVKIFQNAGFYRIDDLEKDIYGNLFESCVAGKSSMYWLVRGDLEFFVDSTTKSIQTSTLEYSHMIVAILCIYLIGRVFARYYRPHVSIFMMCASLTFIVVSEGFSYIEEKLTDYLAQQNSSCWSYAANETARRYKPELVTPQLLVNLRREIRQMPVNDRRLVDIVFPNISLVKNDFLVQAVLPAHIIDSSDQRLIDMAQHFAIATYCNNNSYFRLARALNVRLFWTLLDETGQPAKFLTIDSKNCRNE